MFFPPNATGSMLMVKTLCLVEMVVTKKWIVMELETETEMVLIMEVEMEMIKKRDENTDKNGKVNEKSKWKNGK